uniref:Asparagine synthetase domain-containing protein n=1 Tax=Globodera rostochiensis TaxID=31243 RepID=A0A914GPM6_GLORO
MKGVDFDTGQEIIDKTPFALVGSGSDEQLGGYARHQTVFKSKGLQGLATELSMEMHRIGARNFGRDDRIGTANGKSILAPFLEEPFVRWLNTLPTALKTGFGLPNGAPNKFLLRNALRFLGVPEYFVQRPKRAMQFGTRMVKMEAIESGGAKLKGHQMCKKLLPRNGSANANDGEGRVMPLSD